MQVREMPEFSNVNYLGHVPNTQIPEIMSSCSIGANTLLNIGQYHHIDTFGVKVFEYMSMGLPVLLPNYPYMRKMVEKYKFGVLVEPEDILSISSAINYLCDSPDTAKELGENGRAAIEEEFNWQTQESKLLELYDSILMK